jgi:hypothetical protein
MLTDLSSWLNLVQVLFLVAEALLWLARRVIDRRREAQAAKPDNSEKVALTSEHDEPSAKS